MIRFLAALLVCGSFGCSAAAGRPEPEPSPALPNWSEGAEASVLISYVTPDSLGLELADSGFVMVLEHQPGLRPEVLYPPLDEEWQVHGVGILTLRIPVGILATDSGPVEPTPQCIIRPVVITSWSRDAGSSEVPARDACGPIASIRPDDWPRMKSKAIHPNYEFSTHQRTYLLAIIVDPQTPPRSIGGMSPPVPEAPPVLIARRIGAAMGWQPSHGQRWQAALWIVR